MDNWQSNKQKRILIDNGSSSIRIGNATQQNPLISGNTLVGENLDQQLEENSLIYLKPHVRGVLVDVENQVYLWEKILEQMMEQEVENFNGYSLSLTYHPGWPMKVTQRIFELALEYFQFDTFYPALSQEMIYHSSISEQNYNLGTKEFSLIVESSHSATYVVPIFDQEVVKHAIKRLDIGGKLLTKQIQQNITSRYLDLKKEYRLCKQIKEDMCFVSMNFLDDIKKPKNSHLRYFVLPDYDLQIKGEMTQTLDKSKNQQTLRMDKDQFTIPELLFNPSDISLMQEGIAQSCMKSLSKLNPDIQNYFLENIILSGGNTKFQNFEQRFKQDLQSRIPEYINCETTLNQNINPFDGLYHFNNYDNITQNFISKQEYNERGIEQLAKSCIV